MASQFPFFEENPKQKAPVKGKRPPPLPLDKCETIGEQQLNPQGLFTDPTKPLLLLFGFIAIGCIDIASDISKLVHEGITNVLNCYQKLEDVDEEVKKKYKPVISLLCLPFLDSNGANLIAQLPAAFDFIEQTKKNNGKILVHCYAGISRSVSIVMAYLIWVNYKEYKTIDDVFVHVKSIRVEADPNFSFSGQLKVFLGLKKENPEIALTELCEMVSTEIRKLE